MSDKKPEKDHKQIGLEQELFFTNDIAPGAPFWLPKGMIIFKELENYIRELLNRNGYQEISTPIMVKSELFVKSGHFSKFGVNNMYNLGIYEDEEKKEIETILASRGEREKIEESYLEHNKNNPPLNPKSKIWPVQLKNGRVVEVEVVMIVAENNKYVLHWEFLDNYTLKPMNCPESTIVFSMRPRSYKELPLRLSEIGRLHRREKSGEVNGLLRVRQLTMDDSHNYVTVDQIFEEVSNILDMMSEFYKKFGFDPEFKLATRPEQFAGTIESWNEAEKDLEEVLKRKNLKYELKPQDGAFYGPKIDVHIKDSLGREWQLATVQVDFWLPEAFDLHYIDKDGKRKRPVIIHRAILGSFERFIGILTEHYQGTFPLWLSPLQVEIIPITDKHVDVAKKTAKIMTENDIRTDVDERAETLQAKIRDAALQKVPYICIIGDKEIENKKKISVSIRTRDGKDLGMVDLSQFLERVKDEIGAKK